MTIREVSKKYNVSSDTLRYYERIGLIPPVSRNKSGIRDYKEVDCQWVGFVKCMRGAGMPVEVLIDYVQLCLKGDTTISARVKILKEQRKRVEGQLKELEATFEKLNTKIERYESTLLVAEKKLIASSAAHNG